MDCRLYSASTDLCRQGGSESPLYRNLTRRSVNCPCVFRRSDGRSIAAALDRSEDDQVLLFFVWRLAEMSTAALTNLPLKMHG